MSAAPPPPVTKLVDDTVAIQLPASPARASITCTSPSSADRCVEPDGAPPRFAAAGAEIDSAPVTMLNVVAVDAGGTTASACPADGRTTPPAVSATPSTIRNDLLTNYPRAAGPARRPAEGITVPSP